MPAKLKSHTLGCKVNQYETQYVCEGLHSIGYEDAAPDEAVDFEQTCRVAREVGFSKIHIFPFSPRCGTPAADMPEPVSHSIKSARGKRLSQIESETRQAYFDSLIGTRLRVLAESTDPTQPRRRHLLPLRPR